uniref:Uncharacterized protein n=1 Tax=Arundo donax TaxID=35708 RepID=A0A0A8YGS2_ARUDO
MERKLTVERASGGGTSRLEWISMDFLLLPTLNEEVEAGNVFYVEG